MSHAVQFRNITMAVFPRVAWVKLRLSDVERERSEVSGKVLKSSIGFAKGAELLKVSYRQVLRDCGSGSRTTGLRA